MFCSKLHLFHHLIILPSTSSDFHLIESDLFSFCPYLWVSSVHTPVLFFFFCNYHIDMGTDK